MASTAFGAQHCTVSGVVQIGTPAQSGSAHPMRPSPSSSVRASVHSCGGAAQSCGHVEKDSARLEQMSSPQIGPSGGFSTTTSPPQSSATEVLRRKRADDQTFVVEPNRRIFLGGGKANDSRASKAPLLVTQTFVCSPETGSQNKRLRIEGLLSVLSYVNWRRDRSRVIDNSPTSSTVVRRAFGTLAKILQNRAVCTVDGQSAAVVARNAPLIFRKGAPPGTDPFCGNGQEARGRDAETLLPIRIS